MLRWVRNLAWSTITKAKIWHARRQFAKLLPQQQLLFFASLLDDYPEIRQRFRRSLGMQDAPSPARKADIEIVRASGMPSGLPPALYGGTKGRRRR